ncbi:MAG: MBOAT family protein [Sedimentisphaerales bacterium]|nr:MBOAT family protein [Sedimentisphaerales bacterium]
MLFHTWPFALFFIIVYPTYLVLKNTKLRFPCLLAASYFFYACFNPLYLVLISYSTLLDYFVVIGMEKSSRKKIWLTISIINSLGLLGFFKYGAFVTDNINLLLSSLKIPFELASPGILLPVGISFYIFQSMSYTIDFYRGNIEREKSLIKYATFVSLFPRLVAGPIERAKNLLPQLHKPSRISIQDVTDGISLFIVGFFKKVALADYLAMYVDRVYDAPEQFHSPALVLAAFLFSWQIYFDFSGYTDMARGIARLMGFRLMLNFNNPYLATGLGDFWARWHISLSSWFRDYVYIPLGGNRKGKFNTYRNMFLTLVISGLWHGAAWTFVIWGAVHAIGYSFTRELERTAFYKNRVPKIAKQLLVFIFVSFAWIFFRAETINDAWTIIIRIFSSGLKNPYCPLLALLLIAVVWLYQFIYESRIKWLLELKLVRIGIILLIVFYLVIFAPAGDKAFIYLQF